MARQGRCDTFKHGSELASQVGYRLGGITPEKSLSRADQERQIDYRIGSGSVDSRQVWFLGSGGTAAQLGYRPGERVCEADGSIVRDAMFGIDRRTGKRIPLKEMANPAARLAAAPVLAVLEKAWTDGKVDPTAIFRGVNSRERLDALRRAGQRPNGTISFTTVASLVRSNEFEWDRYEQAGNRPRKSGDAECAAPAYRAQRTALFRAIGAHHRALHEAGGEQSFGGRVVDLDSSDEALGSWIWNHVEAESRRKVLDANC